MKTKSFAFIAEGDVFNRWNIEYTEGGPMEMLIAGLSSDPIIVEVPEGIAVESGWTYDGTSFQPPSN